MSSTFKPVIKLLAELPPAQLEELMGCFKQLKIKKGEYLLKIGQVCKHMYLINTGAIRHFRLNKKGEEMSTWFSFEEDVVSVMESFVKQIPCDAGLVAMEETEVSAIHLHQVDALRKKYHQFETFSRKLIEEYMIFTERRSYSMQENDALGRYQDLIMLNPKVQKRVSQTHIASFLGIKKETLSRLKKKQND